jgi:hypothetical protein
MNEPIRPTADATEAALRAYGTHGDDGPPNEDGVDFKRIMTSNERVKAEIPDTGGNASYWACQGPREELTKPCPVHYPNSTPIRVDTRPLGYERKKDTHSNQRKTPRTNHGAGFSFSSRLV